jgi:DNA-directed RNA polymerase specialized sigma24 family protein
MRDRHLTEARSPYAKKSASRWEQPGAFQCAILRALELPQHHRDVFFLKEIQGHSLTETAAILGITAETARVRLKRAHRAIGQLGDSVATGRAQ